MSNLNFKSLLPLIIFVLLAIFLGIGLTLNPREIPSALISKPAPAFTLPSLTDPNVNFSPNDLIGKTWILNVWASWCAACRIEHPLFNQLAANTDLTLVGLNYKDESVNAQQWLQQRGDPYTYIPQDLKGDVGIDWGVYGVPETFVINPEGLIIYKHVGPVTQQILNDEILPLFNQ